MNTNADKKDLFYIIVLILTIITVVVGVTFALYALIFSQKEGTSAVYTGTFSIEYLSGNIIDCNLLYPINDPSYTSEKNVYKNTFKVSNIGTLDSLLKVQIEINKNEFSNKTLKYKLFSSEQEELSEGYIEGVADVTVGNNIELKSAETAEFTLVIWIDENGKNQNEEMKKNLTGLIKVDASQKIN